MENGTDFQQYLRAEYSGEHFSWTLQGSPEGTASLNVTPDTGYTVKSVTLNDAAMERDTSGAFTFTVPSDRMDLAVNLGIIQKSGAWFAYNDGKIGQGRENAKIFLRENPEIAEEIERQVRAHYGLGEDGPQDAEKDVDKAKDVLTDASDDEV